MQKSEGIPRVKSSEKIDWSARSDMALDQPSRGGRPIDLGTLSNQLGVPRGQSRGTVRKPMQRRSSSKFNTDNNAIDWNARSDLTDVRQSRVASRRGSNFDDARKRSHSLDNLPEHAAVFHDRPKVQERKSDPLLGSNLDFGDVQENLYDEVLMDLFASVANNGQGNPELPPKQQRRNSVMSKQTIKSSKSNESMSSAVHRASVRRNSNWEDAQFQPAPNSPFTSTKLSSSRSQENLDEAFLQPRKSSADQKFRSRSHDNLEEAFQKQQQQQLQKRRSSGLNFSVRSSSSHDNLDEAFLQRRNSVVKRNNNLRNSRSHDNLDQVFGQQGIKHPGSPQRPMQRVNNLKEGGNMLKMLKLATQIEQERMNNPEDQDAQERIRNFTSQIETLRIKSQEDRDRKRNSDDERRSSAELSNSGISNLTGYDASDEEMRRLSNASARSGSSAGMIITEIVPANIPGANGGRRRKSFTKSRMRRPSIDKIKEFVQAPPLTRRTSRITSVGFSTDSNGDVPINIPKRSSNADLQKLKLFDDINAVTASPTTRLDTSDKQTKTKPNKISRLDSSDRAKIVTPNTADNDRQRMRLYDELVSASNTDRKLSPPNQEGTASTMQPLHTTQTHPLLDRSLKSINSFGSKKKKTTHRRRWCREKDKKVMLGLVFLLLGIIGGYLVFLYAPGLNSESSNNQDAADTDSEPSIVISTDLSTTVSKINGTAANEPSKTDVTSANTNQSNSTAIAPPPPDIEGMCSVSNLPGSLSKCLSACLPSACCYPGYDDESCLDESDPESKDACYAYRPYCDVFYDPWADGTEGVLRNVTDDMVNMCSGGKNIVMNEGSTSDSLSTGVKRLRGHHIQVDTSHESLRKLKAASDHETCEQYCIAGRCCIEPVITFPESSGLILSPTGVYTNATNGEFVVTSCQASNSRNIQLCVQYEAICSIDEDNASGLSSKIPTQNPVELPTILVPKPAPSTSPAQSAVSSSTNGPTPSAPSNIGLATDRQTPVPSSRANQVTDQPSKITPEVSNQPTQAPVIIFNETTSAGNFSVNTTDLLSSQVPSQSPSPSTTQVPSAINVSSTASIIIPSAPVADIEEACTSDKAVFLISTGNPHARSKCIKACQEGICCFTTQLGYDWMDSCYDDNKQVCAEYSACLILQGEDTSQPSGQTNATAVDPVNSDNETSDYTENEYGDSSQTIEIPAENVTAAANETDEITVGPPTPDQDLSVLCSEDNITQTSGLKKCIKACDNGRCCGATDETECFTTHNEICSLYAPCNNAYNLLYSD